ncbi:hypothetical protein [Paenibacillus sp. 481]|uniref:hypothetical protein n=1 Tax=Paenibacillus sp. 481 TaxID=2835869 RepID=UPI003FA70E22
MGLYYNRLRYYSPIEGTYTQQAECAFMCTYTIHCHGLIRLGLRVEILHFTQM